MLRRRASWSSLVVVFAVACGSDHPPQRAEPEQTPPPRAQTLTQSDNAEALAQTKARDAAMTLGRTLKKRLFDALSQGGPSAAISVCANEAHAITQAVARDRGAQVGRSSLRLRNPRSAGPTWVRARLEQLGERSAQGVEPFSEIVNENGKRVARFAAPIAIEGPCLTCHGPQDAIPDDVRAVLNERYPSDRAHGYAAGDLRGLLWAEVVVDSAK